MNHNGNAPRCAMAIFAAFLLAAPRAHAMTILVGSSADDDGANCTLRQAIDSLNAQTLDADCESANEDAFGSNDTVDLSLLALFPGPIEIDPSAVFNIQQSMSLVGPGADVLTLSGSTLFAVPAGSAASYFNVSGLTMTGAAAAPAIQAVNAQTDISITDSLLTGNNAAIVETSGSLTLVRSAVTGNTADTLLSASHTVKLINSTISGNQVSGSLILSTADSVVENSTLIEDSGALVFDTAQPVNLHNSIVIADGAVCSGSAGAGSLPSDVFVSDASCGTGLHAGIDPALLDLQPLAANGGPSQTIALGAGSLAIGAGDSAICANDDVADMDQRGYERGSAACDAGAYEYAGVRPSIKLPRNLQFASTPIGFIDFRFFKIRNTGAVPLRVKSFDIDGPQAGNFLELGDTCLGASVSPGSYCQVLVAFFPCELGAASARLKVVSEATPRPRMVRLSGTGLLPPPENLQASQGAGKVSLGWSAVDGAASYNVYLQSGTDSPVLALTGVTATSADVSGLTAGKTYCLMVVAVAGDGTEGGPAFVEVRLPKIPTVSIAFDKTSVYTGAPAVLSFSSADRSSATTCDSSGTWHGSRRTSGKQTISRDRAGTYTYTLTCSNSSGSDTQSASLTVTDPPPTLSFSSYSLNFVARPVGTRSSTTTVTIYNRGDALQTINNALVLGGA
ncbi:MAG TPA: choice-of-anchor Q domain-containing protein, partial [Nevskiaceae bacterium]|nr:choice-of-anchor Q domain-containing protein [Nevskiaceae bacterium]